MEKMKKEKKRSQKVTKQTVITILRQSGYSYEQTRNIRITEREADDISAALTDSNNIRTVKTKEGKTHTAAEISGGLYKLIKSIWISPQTKASDIRDIICSLPKDDIREAEQNSALDILSRKFKISKRGSD